MRLDARFGSDTGIYLVDVLLETPEERRYDDEQIARRVDELRIEAGLDAGDVFDFSVRVQNNAGQWVYATRDAEGTFVPYDWA